MMSTSSTNVGHRFLPLRAGAFKRFVQFLSMASRARMQRRMLMRLDDRLLCDIGATRHEAADEAARSFWDVPANWRN